MDGDSNLEVSKGIFAPGIPKDIIFPDELNRYLREQIEYLTHENGMLKKNLDQNEASLTENHLKIENLTRKLKEYENSGEKHQYSVATTLASTKIVELSRRIREKNAEVESWKTKCSKLEKKIFEMQDMKNDEKVTQKSESRSPSKTETEDQQKKLQEKLNATLLKMRELQNANIQLKNDLKMANKYLQQEVGDTLDTISNNNQGWRGRAQIICDLQQKNQELKEKLKSHLNRSEKSFILGHNGVFKDGEEISKKTEDKLNTLHKENEDLKNSLEEQKKRNDILRARCKVLESEQLNNKNRITSLISQTERDHNLIQTLTNQMTHQQNVTNETIKQKDKSIKGLQQDNEVLKIELSKQKYTIENLTKNLNEKIEEIRDLMRSKRKSPRPLSSYGQRNNNLMDERLVGRLEAEKARLLELAEVQATRISAERDSHAKTQERFRAERQRAAKLETDLAKLELEYSTLRSGGSYYAMSTNRSLDAKKNAVDLKGELELAQETIKALKTRLEIEQHERKVDLKEFSKILESHN